MKEQPRIRVTVEVPVLAADGSEDRCKFYREWEIRQRGRSVTAAVKRCFNSAFADVENDFVLQSVREDKAFQARIAEMARPKAKIIRLTPMMLKAGAAKRQRLTQSA